MVVPKTIDLFRIHLSFQQQIPQNQMTFHQCPEYLSELKIQFDHTLISIPIDQTSITMNLFFIQLFNGGFFQNSIFISENLLKSSLFRRFRNLQIALFSNLFIELIIVQKKNHLFIILSSVNNHQSEQIQYQMLFKGTPYVNKHIKKREEERVMEYHASNLRNLRSIRPSTGTNFDTVDAPAIMINNKKKQMLLETRFTEIEKANRILLVKITGIMNKRKNNSVSSNQMNRSLNSSLRKRQMQNIELQNAKMLKRLQDKKPHYETDKLKAHWKFQKNVIKILTNYPQVPNDRRRLQSKPRTPIETNVNLNSNFEICRVRVISGTNFLITLRLTKQKLQIVGDSKSRKEIKVIDIQRSQAIDFILNQCDGEIEKIFDQLRYDSSQQVLYLVAKDAEINPERQQDKQLQQNTQFRVKEELKKPKQWVELKPNENNQESEDNQKDQNNKFMEDEQNFE